MMPHDAGRRIKQTVVENPVVVFSKTYCGYCDRVKHLLVGLGVKDAYVVELDNDPHGSDIQQQLFKMTSSFTVPSVWIGSEYIGGCDTTTELHSRGGLVPKITAAKAAAAAAAAAAATAAAAAPTSTVGTVSAQQQVETSESRIAAYVKANPVAVFCDTRKQAENVVELLAAGDVPAPAVFEFEPEDEGPKLKEALGKQAGTFALPSVWIGGKPVGGLQDVEKLNAFGNLVPKIAAAVAAHEAAVEEEERKIADDLISNHVASQPVALFSKTFCRYSNAVKDMLLASDITPAVFELDKHPKGHAVMEELVRQTGRLTVPSVWVGAKHIGGSEEVKALLDNGELTKFAQVAPPVS